MLEWLQSLTPGRIQTFAASAQKAIAKVFWALWEHIRTLCVVPSWEVKSQRVKTVTINTQIIRWWMSHFQLLFLNKTLGYLLGRIILYPPHLAAQHSLWSVKASTISSGINSAPKVSIICNAPVAQILQLPNRIFGGLGNCQSCQLSRCAHLRPLNMARQQAKGLPAAGGGKLYFPRGVGGYQNFSFASQIWFHAAPFCWPIRQIALEQISNKHFVKSFFSPLFCMLRAQMWAWLCCRCSGSQFAIFYVSSFFFLRNTQTTFFSIQFWLTA